MSSMLTIYVALMLGFCAGIWVSNHEYELKPCLTEDSDGCYWDATKQGNGEGKSFIAQPDGTVIYIGD